MKYLEFKNIFRKFPIISSSHIFNLTTKPRSLKNQLSIWQRKGLVIKLKKGLYILNEQDRKITPSRLFMANALYSPSYISTEYALSYYGLIPERVEDLTSVTTKKTIDFKNLFGTFRYQHLKTELFFGMTQITDENGLLVLLAYPEKAMLDFIYLNLQDFKNKGMDIFEDSYRFGNLNILKKKRLMEFAKRYKNKVFMDIVNNLLNFMNQKEQL
ncbi:MAG: hypothetical protein AB1397_07415 [bacterium]